MERATPTSTRWLLALALLVVVAMVAALVTVNSPGGPSVAVDMLAEEGRSDGGSGPGDVPDLESDPTLFDAEIHWINPASLQPDSGGTLTHNDISGCAYNSSTAFLQATLDLPNGATILGATAYYNDANATSNQGVYVEITRHSSTNPGGGTAPGFEVLFNFNSDGSSATAAPGYSSAGLEFIGSEGSQVVDLTTDTYTVYVSTDAAATSTMICGLQILWAPEDDDGLVFYPVEPCAVYDTRASQGGRGTPLASNETVTFDTVMSDYSGQGGVGTSCGIPDEAGGGFLGGNVGTEAVMINVVALNASGSGNFKVWNEDDAEPDGGALVFKSPTNTNTVLPMGISRDVFNFFGPDTEGGFISVKNNGGGTVDLRVVVVGYFGKVEANQT